MMQDGMMPWGMWPVMLFAWVFSILLLVLLVLAIVWLWKQIRSGDGRRPPPGG